MLCTYIDLDRLIAACDMPEQQREFLEMLMAGYSLTDIAETGEQDHAHVERQFRNAVHRIVRQNQRQWEAVYARKSCRHRK